MPKSKQVATAIIAFIATTLIVYAMLAGAASQRLPQYADWWNHPLAWMCSIGLGLVIGLFAYNETPYSRE